MDADQINYILNRSNSVFHEDFQKYISDLQSALTDARVLVIGASGTIGSAVCMELVKFDLQCMHLIDVSENNLVETVRRIRSSVGFFENELKTFVIDITSRYFDQFCASNRSYDYIFNLSALKHVRSEKDFYSLNRMIDVNIIASMQISKYAAEIGCKKYFSVSTDKATNPVNMMGASKKIMENILSELSNAVPTSFARFANVAFSDGSLLKGFQNRFLLKQPFSAPKDIKRYFISDMEAGKLCILSALIGENLDIFFPSEKANLKETSFVDIGERYLEVNGYKAFFYDTDDAARENFKLHIAKSEWSFYTFYTDTTGEKKLEEFYADTEVLSPINLKDVSAVNLQSKVPENYTKNFLQRLKEVRDGSDENISNLVKLFEEFLPEFSHAFTGKNLDGKM